MNKIALLLALTSLVGVAHASGGCEAKVVNAPVAEVSRSQEPGLPFQVDVVALGSVYGVKSHDRPTGDTYPVVIRQCGSKVHAVTAVAHQTSFGGGGVILPSGAFIHDTNVFGPEFKVLIDGKAVSVRGMDECRPKVNPPIEYSYTGKEFWARKEANCIVIGPETRSVVVEFEDRRRETWSVQHEPDGSFRLKRPNGLLAAAA
ncbi:hypothetical protein [Burkholderia vietnamiensis]|uniref:hypothetical protein n=1 Tax=Burkholderia vietnamiensis TaxID=60552 RepID=UPI00158CE1CC|nr:hypothetical protein [Burkholderia vietnamiensis]